MATPAVFDIGTLIVSTPGVVGGSPRIAGTRISVKHIAAFYNDGMTPEEMLEQFPTIDLKGAHAAITYYLSNKEAVDADLADEEREVQQFLREYPQGRGPDTLPAS